MVLPVHLQLAAVVAIVDCRDQGRFGDSRSLKQAVLQSIWLFQESRGSHRTSPLARSIPLSPLRREEPWPRVWTPLAATAIEPPPLGLAHSGRLQLLTGGQGCRGWIRRQGIELLLDFAGDDPSVLLEVLIVRQGHQELLQVGRIAAGDPHQ